MILIHISIINIISIIILFQQPSVKILFLIPTQRIDYANASSSNLEFNYLMKLYGVQKIFRTNKRDEMLNWDSLNLNKLKAKEFF